MRRIECFQDDNILSLETQINNWLDDMVKLDHVEFEVKDVKYAMAMTPEGNEYHGAIVIYSTYRTK